MGAQYDPVRVWFILNELYDNTHEFGTGSPNAGGSRTDIYVIRNLIRDNIDSGLVINAAGDGIGVINNTIFNNPRGISNGYYTSKIDIANNIIARASTHIDFPDYGSAA